jgi:hypothetical protein
MLPLVSALSISSARKDALYVFARRELTEIRYWAIEPILQNMRHYDKAA